MTVSELIHKLSALRIPNAVVTAFDADSRRCEAVSGFVYDSEVIELQTDSDYEGTEGCIAESMRGKRKLKK